MAKIIENQHGGRRQIRLSAEDVAMVVSAYQRRTQQIKSPTGQDLRHALQGNPIYLPEDV